MRLFPRLAAIVAAGLFLSAPVTAQQISALPSATALTGAEKLAGIQGSGCATHTAPCATVAVTAVQIATLANATAQPLDSDLTAIAALTTASFGRSLLTETDASATRSAIGLGTIATQAAGAVAITGGSIAGITDLALADGGTGASTAANARTNLGVAIGTNVQGYDADLTTYAGITPSTNVQSLLGATDYAAIRAQLGVPWTVARAGAVSSITGTVTETTLGTFTIPAGAMGPNGQLEIISLWTSTSSANNKIFKITFGGSILWTATVTTTSGYQTFSRAANRNAANAQVVWANTGGGFGAGQISAAVAYTIDTTAAVTVNLTCTLANTGESCSLESFIARITYGA